MMKLSNNGLPIIEVVQRVNVITHMFFYTNLYKHATCIIEIDCLKSQFSNIKFGLRLQVMILIWTFVVGIIWLISL